MQSPIMARLLAGLAAGVTAYLSVALLMRYFKQNEIEALKPFAFYCWIAGAIALLVMSNASILP